MDRLLFRMSIFDRGAAASLGNIHLRLILSCIAFWKRNTISARGSTAHSEGIFQRPVHWPAPDSACTGLAAVRETLVGKSLFMHLFFIRTICRCIETSKLSSLSSLSSLATGHWSLPSTTERYQSHIFYHEKSWEKSNQNHNFAMPRRTMMAKPFIFSNKHGRVP